MITYNKLRKGLLIILSILLTVSIGVTALMSANTAKAGNFVSNVIDEDFNSQSLGKDSWYSNDNMRGTEFNASQKPSLWMKEPILGSAITSKKPVTTDNVRLELDVKEMDFGAEALTKGGAYFSMVYNLKDYNDGTAFKAEQEKTTEPGDGVVFVYHRLAPKKLVFTTAGGTCSEFVDKNGKALTRQCQSDGTPGTELASSWAWFDASMILDADDQTKITNKTITVDVANGGLKIYVKEMGEEGLGELVARTADNPEIPVDAVSSELPYTAFVASKSDNVFENVIISDFRVSGENAGQRTVFNKFDAQTINDWSVYKTDKTTSMYFGYDYSLKLNSKFSNEYPLMIRNMVSINEPDDLYSYAKVISKIKVNTLVQNSKIGFLSGVEKLSDAKIGQVKTTFVYLVKDGDAVKLGIDSYHTANQVKEILAPTIVSVDDQGFVQVESQIDHKGRIKVVANGTDVYESTQDNEGYAKRYIGVALSGAKTGLDVEFADVKLVNQFYQRPQNTNILATFEDDPTTTDVDESDSFNKNEWHLQSFPYLDTYTNTAYVNDGQLVFENLAMNTSFATKRQYSDFEIQIDITDLRREVVKDASGNKNFPISAFIGIYWGVPTADFKFGNGVGSAYPHIYIGPEVDIDTWDRQKDDNGKNKPVLIRCQGVGLDNMFELPSHYDFWDPIMEGEVLQYKIRVVEKDVTVSVKYDFEDEWYVIANLKLSRAIVGSVGITTMGCNYYVPVISEGASCGWCKLDNIKVTNLDNKPNLTTLEYAVSRSNMPQDFPYVDKNNDEEYLIKDGQENGGCSSSFNAGMIAVGTISACASLFVVRKLRGKKDEEI